MEVIKEFSPQIFGGLVTNFERLLDEPSRIFEGDDIVICPRCDAESPLAEFQFKRQSRGQVNGTHSKKDAEDPA